EGDDAVPLGASKPKSPSDSDIRLEDLPSMSGRGREAGNVITEEIDLDAEAQKAAQKAVPPRAKTKKKQSKAQPPLPTEAPFELSDPDLGLDKPAAPRKGEPRKSAVRKNEVDSSSDFEMIPFDSAKAPEPGSGDVPVLDDDAVDFGELSGGKGAS